MRKLFTEQSTLLVGGLVAVLVLMRIVLAMVRPGTGLARFILWFWHTDARHRSPEDLATPAGREREAERQDKLYHDTLLNMDGTLVALALVFFVIRPFVVQAFFIPSSSMEPTLMGDSHRQDRVLVNKYLYHLRPPKRQEIVVFHAPPAALMDPSQKQDFIKRLIGVPGDVVEVRGNRAIINGVPLDEPYLPPDALNERPFLFDDAGDPSDFGPVTVPPGKYLMMGDNRNNSHDSRRWGRYQNDTFVHEPFVDADRVLGKAMCVFWPPQGMRLLRTPGNR